MMRRGLSRQRLLAVFFAAAVLFNYPFVSLFEGSGLVSGFPPVFIYLFLIWAVVILIVALIVERAPQ